MMLKSSRYVRAQRYLGGSSKDVLEAKGVRVICEGRIQGEKVYLYIKQLTAYRSFSSRVSNCRAAVCAWWPEWRNGQPSNITSARWYSSDWQFLLIL